MKRRQVLGIVLMIVGVVFGLAAMWVWALTGMSTPVGAASAATSFTLAFVGAMTCMP